MTATSATDAIATLMTLAQQGEIDPWDVQVIEVIDRFLEELGLLGGTSLYQEADLPKSGQAFLWASMLVLLKAKTLDLEEEEVTEPDELPETETPYTLPVALEERLRRRSSAPPPRRRRVTLQELIEQIKQIATEVEMGASRRPPRPRPQSRREAVRTIASLAHNENLTEIAAQLEEVLRLNLPQLALEQGYIELEELVGWWAQTMPAVGSLSEVEGDRVGVFWALLLLSAQSKVELEQAEFYQDLKIKFLCGGHSPEQ